MAFFHPPTAAFICPLALITITTFWLMSLFPSFHSPLKWFLFHFYTYPNHPAIRTRLCASARTYSKQVMLPILNEVVSLSVGPWVLWGSDCGHCFWRRGLKYWLKYKLNWHHFNFIGPLNAPFGYFSILLLCQYTVCVGAEGKDFLHKATNVNSTQSVALQSRYHGWCHCLTMCLALWTAPLALQIELWVRAGH